MLMARQNKKKRRWRQHNVHRTWFFFLLVLGALCVLVSPVCGNTRKVTANIAAPSKRLQCNSVCKIEIKYARKTHSSAQRIKKSYTKKTIKKKSAEKQNKK